jgi:hypothetical protein
MAHDTKQCSKCQLEKHFSAFHKNTRKPDGHSDQCKSCRKNYYSLPQVKRQGNLNRQKNYSSIKRKAQQLRKYGLSLADYDAMLEKQGNGCAICGRQLTDPDGRKLAVDHCHKTKVVRGILCCNCNNGLGRFNDDPVLLFRAAVYLSDHPEHVSTPEPKAVKSTNGTHRTLPRPEDGLPSPYEGAE